MKITIFLLLLAGITFGQEFTVEKVEGNVYVMRGVSENWEEVTEGNKLNKKDLVLTGENSLLQLRGSKKRFLLKADAALGLDKVREISLNDLLLALAMEEVKKFNGSESNGEIKNTAVYGSEQDVDNLPELKLNEIGRLKLNGAVQLAENGFKESAILAAKETYNKYPYTKGSVSTRIYFAGLMSSMGLLNEALEELNSIREHATKPEETQKIDKLIEEISAKI